MIEWWNVNWPTAVEWITVALGVIYVVLAIKEKRAAWPVGIVGSGMGFFLFMDARLYSEAGLHVVYVLQGFFGWWSWRKPAGDDTPLPIHTWSYKAHGAAVLVAAVMALLLGLFFYKGTDAANPFLDATTTAGALVATILTARKVLGNWIWWIVIDALTIYMYARNGLHAYAGLMGLYTVMAFGGYLEWKKTWKAQQLA